MKYALLLFAILALSACKDDRPRINGTVDVTGYGYNLACIDGVKYIKLWSAGISPKISPITKQPELCNE